MAPEMSSHRVAGSLREACHEAEADPRLDGLRRGYRCQPVVEVPLHSTDAVPAVRVRTVRLSSSDADRVRVNPRGDRAALRQQLASQAERAALGDAHPYQVPK